MQPELITSKCLQRQDISPNASRLADPSSSSALSPRFPSRTQSAEMNCNFFDNLQNQLIVLKFDLIPFYSPSLFLITQSVRINDKNKVIQSVKIEKLSFVKVGEGEQSCQKNFISFIVVTLRMGGTMKEKERTRKRGMMNPSKRVRLLLQMNLSFS